MAGSVGMLDGSASGTTQYFAAPTRPPHLRALFVRQGLSDMHTDVFYQGGAHLLELMRTYLVKSVLLPQLGRRPGALADPATRLRVEQADAEYRQSLWHLPLTAWPAVEGLADWYWESLDHPDDGPFWAATDLAQVAHEVNLPILDLSSWYDPFLRSVLKAYTSIREHGRSAACRDGQRLILGPWSHSAAAIGQRQVGALDFGPRATFDLNQWRLRWYDHWLKDAETGIMEGPRVRIFLMGTNRWLGFDAWPPGDIAYRPLYLGSGPAPGRGRLAFDPPAADNSTDAYVYDPADPILSQFPRLDLAPTDYSSVEDRLLTYTSAPLTEDLHVVGPLTMVLYAASSAPDTDWVVRLCDLWPDGRSILVTDGILRARYRESFERQVLMEPGTVYRFDIDLGATALTFLAGHCLHLQVTSSDFPRFDRNPNTGGPFAEETSWQVATNTIYHDLQRPSHLRLPTRSLVATDLIEMPPPP